MGRLRARNKRRIPGCQRLCRRRISLTDRPREAIDIGEFRDRGAMGHQIAGKGRITAELGPLVGRATFHDAVYVGPMLDQQPHTVRHLLFQRPGKLIVEDPFAVLDQLTVFADKPVVPVLCA